MPRATAFLALLLPSLLLADDKPSDTKPQAPAGDPIEYFGIKTEATHVLFVIDRSGSMFWNPKGEKERSKVQIMRDETDKTLAALKDTTFLAILFFSTEPKPWKEAFVQATKANLDDARKRVQKEGTGGGTNFWIAIQRAFQFLDTLPKNEQANVKPAIYLVTDGEVDEAEQVTIRRGIKPLLAKWKPVLNVVCLDATSSFLEQLARENGGTLICPVKPPSRK